MRQSTIRSALLVALLASTGCSLLPTMEDGAEILARRYGLNRPRSTTPTPPANPTTSPTTGPTSPSATQSASSSQSNPSSQSSPDAYGNRDVSVKQVSKVVYYKNGGGGSDGYLGIGTSVAQINAMLNISISNASNVHFRQVNKVDILHDDDEHPEGGNREITDAFLIFGDAVTQINLLKDVTINQASNIRIDQVNKVSLVDAAGHGSDGYLVFPQSGLAEQINHIDASITNSENVSLEQINSILIYDADDFKDLLNATETEHESYLRRQYQSHMRSKEAKGKSRFDD